MNMKLIKGRNKIYGNFYFLNCDQFEVEDNKIF